LSLVLGGIVEIGKVNLHGSSGRIRELFLVEGAQHRLATNNKDVRVVHDRRRRTEDMRQLLTVHLLPRTRVF